MLIISSLLTLWGWSVAWTKKGRAQPHRYPQHQQVVHLSFNYRDFFQVSRLAHEDVCSRGQRGSLSIVRAISQKQCPLITLRLNWLDEREMRGTYPFPELGRGLVEADGCGLSNWSVGVVAADGCPVFSELLALLGPLEEAAEAAAAAAANCWALTGTLTGMEKFWFASV